MGDIKDFLIPINRVILDVHQFCVVKKHYCWKYNISLTMPNIGESINYQYFMIVYNITVIYSFVINTNFMDMSGANVDFYANHNICIRPLIFTCFTYLIIHTIMKFFKIHKYKFGKLMVHS